MKINFSGIDRLSEGITLVSGDLGIEA